MDSILIVNDKIDIKNLFKNNSIIEYNGAFKRTTTCI